MNTLWSVAAAVRVVMKRNMVEATGEAVAEVRVAIARAVGFL